MKCPICDKTLRSDMQVSVDFEPIPGTGCDHEPPRLRIVSHRHERIKK